MADQAMGQEIRQPKTHKAVKNTAYDSASIRESVRTFLDYNTRSVDRESFSHIALLPTIQL